MSNAGNGKTFNCRDPGYLGVITTPGPTPIFHLLSVAAPVLVLVLVSFVLVIALVLVLASVVTSGLASSAYAARAVQRPSAAASSSDMWVALPTLNGVRSDALAGLPEPDVICAVMHAPCQAPRVASGAAPEPSRRPVACRRHRH